MRGFTYSSLERAISMTFPTAPRVTMSITTSSDMAARPRRVTASWYTPRSTAPSPMPQNFLRQSLAMVPLNKDKEVQKFSVGTV